MLERYIYYSAIAALLAGLGGMWIMQQRETGRLNAELAASRQETIAAGQRIVAIQAAQNIVIANRDDLQRQVRRQNSAMDSLRERALTAEAKAGRAAAETTMAVLGKEDRIRAIPGAGPDALMLKVREVYR